MAIFKWTAILFLSLLLLFAVLISLMDWNWVRDYAVRQLSEMTGRTLVIKGDLDISWSLAPHIRLEQIKLENASWSERPYMLEISALELQIDLRRLIAGQIVLPEVSLFSPAIFLEKSYDGKANWEFEIVPVGDPAPDERTEFPVIERLKIENGLLVYDDPAADTDIKATLASVRGTENHRDSFTLQAKGKIQGKTLDVDLNADPLLALQETEKPYKLVLDVRLDDTVAKIDGTLRQPFQLKGLDMYFEVQGPNPGRVSTILGFPMPDLPPYRLAGEISRYGDIWKFSGFDGRVGDSDLTGDIDVDIGQSPLFIKADLTSQKLDLDDLGPLIGIAPDTGKGETASAPQKKEARKEEKTPTVLPKDEIDFEALKQVNADIHLRGKRVESKLPLDDLTMKISIEGGNLILAPLNFGIASGNLRSRIELDASQKPIASKIEAEIRHVRLNEMLKYFDIADDSAGVVGGRAVFWFNGDSIAQMLAAADGGLLMLMTGGQFDNLLIEIAGLDIGETLVALFDDETDTGINCAFVDLPTENGMMSLETLVVDTKDTVFLGKGTIDLAGEKLDLVIDPNPKDLSLFSARAPLHIGGRFSSPDFVPGSSAVLRGAASLALLPSAPIASLISLLEEDGGEENIHCSGLVEAINEAR
ncbi:hypothetical protein SAMN05421690_101538 [Nitrosomonas sp. Nm51]|uniref:AsmA family protein n=1 Tax=Nitrosomonas sp. Nm51 TaxID=133720 RepID=UPI0008D558B8|nr:AsmA family protein [Nitrosomonas sp. Nm51]SER26595.1 hypothetical protein SAMN05421690_101538 [Nitrosomonas sp. Nm51]